MVSIDDFLDKYVDSEREDDLIVVTTRMRYDTSNWFRDLTRTTQESMLVMLKLHENGRVGGSRDWWLTSGLDGVPNRCVIRVGNVGGGSEMSTWSKFIDYLTRKHVRRFYNLDVFEVSYFNSYAFY